MSKLPNNISTPPASTSKAGHKFPQQDGVLVLYKPKGMTSAACIARIKRGFGQKKIGHAGTLDPMAEGVLLVLLGQATKLSGHLMDNGEKIYSGSICLGKVTDTWDAEGEVLEEKDFQHIQDSDIQEAFSGLVGTYEQEVPAYSAAKHQGKPLYALARAGLETPVKRKVISIFRGEAELVGLPHVRFRVSCSSGTYIRSLAHSLGMRLGCGAMLEELIREYSHPFGLTDACSLEQLDREPEKFAQMVHCITKALPEWPKIQLSAEDTARIKNGLTLLYNPQSLAGLPFMPDMKALLLDQDANPLCLAQTEEKEHRQVWTIIRGLWNQEPAKA